MGKWNETDEPIAYVLGQREFYGRMVPFRTSLTGQVAAPEGARPLLVSLSKFAREAAQK